MKLLLTGAGGFLGRCAAHSLLEAGVDDLACISAGRRPGICWTRCAVATLGTIEASAPTCCTPATCPALVNGVECIVHAAAGMRGSAADMFANTVVGTRNLLDAAAVEGVRRGHGGIVLGLPDRGAGAWRGA